jgi:hypothetical protein
MSILTARQAAVKDFTIIGAILAILSSSAILYVSSLPEYQNPVEVSNEMLSVNDFMYDYSRSGAALTQDADSRFIKATVGGEVINEIESRYLDLVITESGEEIIYSLKPRG